MFLKSKRLRKSISLFFAFLCLSAAIPNSVYASPFTEVSYDNAYNYTELENRIVAESSNQSLEFFQMVSKWSSYGTSEEERYTDLSTYIENAKSRYTFVNNYNGSLSDEVKSTYNQYISWMDSSLKSNSTSLIDGPVIFIDYLEKNMSDTQNNYLSFKTDGLDNFLNSYIYTNVNKSAVNNIANGTDVQGGRQAIQNTINSLEGLRAADSNTPVVIKNYAGVYEDYYKKVMNQDFSRSTELLQFQVYKINGLIPVGQAEDELTELNAYVSLFNQFSDYPSVDLAVKVSADKVKQQVQEINKQTVTTKPVQQLKKYHYEFLYQLSEYKSSKDRTDLEKAYNNFDRYYAYLKEYYSKVSSRYGAFSSSTVIKDIQLLKEQSKCINPKLSAINNIEYSSPTQKDSNSYRIFDVNGDINMVSIFKIICIVGLVLLASFIILFLVIRTKRYIKEQRDALEEDDDSYY